MTLGVLAAYRGRGIGTQLIQSVLDHVAEHNQQPHNQIDQVALHVQISNQDAIRFYTTRFGFVQGEMVENYYRRIEPPHCYLLYKNI
jgi:ribosomal protein S18 acetylase RimI-like enzyme